MKVYLFFMYLDTHEINTFPLVKEYLEQDPTLAEINGYHRILYAWTDDKVLRDIFERDRKMNLFGKKYSTIKFDKKEYSEFSLRYLGRELDCKGINPNIFAFTKAGGVGKVVGTCDEFDYAEINHPNEIINDLLNSGKEIPPMEIFSEKYKNALDKIGYLFETMFDYSEFYMTGASTDGLLINEYLIFCESFGRLYKQGGLDVESI